MRRYKGYSCLCLCRSRGSMHELGTSSDKHHLASMFRGKFSKSRERLVSHLSYESRLFSRGSQCWGDSTLSSSLVVNSIGTAGVMSRLANSVPGIAAEKTGRLHNPIKLAPRNTFIETIWSGRLGIDSSCGKGKQSSFLIFENLRGFVRNKMSRQEDRTSIFLYTS